MKEYEKFLQLFDMIMELGIRRDEHLDSVLLRYLVLAGNMEGAERIYASAKERDIKTYVVFLGSLAKMGKKEEMERVVQDMEKKGVSLNDDVYRSLISCRGTSFAESWKLFDEMKAKNISPTISTYSALIYRAGFTNELEMIEKILLEVETSGIETDSYFYKAVSGAYQRCGRADLAVDFLLQVKEERGVLLKDSVAVLLILFESETLQDEMASMVEALNRNKSEVIPSELTDQVLQILSNIKTEAIERLSIKE